MPCGPTSTTPSGSAVRTHNNNNNNILELHPNKTFSHSSSSYRLMWPAHASMLLLFFYLEPIFVDAHLIPDGTDPNDAKLYFFFRERLTDNSGNTKNIHTMVARVCPVST